MSDPNHMIMVTLTAAQLRRICEWAYAAMGEDDQWLVYHLEYMRDVADKGCFPVPWSSRGCQKGTRSCEIDHSKEK